MADENMNTGRKKGIFRPIGTKNLKPTKPGMFQKNQDEYSPACATQQYGSYFHMYFKEHYASYLVCEISARGNI
jgi:hypothetical protein